MNQPLQRELDFSPTPPPATVTAPNMASLIALVLTWSDLSQVRRRDMASALRSLVQMLELPAEAVRCDVGWLNAHLPEAPAAAFDLEQRRLENVLSLVRAVLRRLGLHAPDIRGEQGLPQAWIEFLQAAPHPAVRSGLRAFARYCDTRGMSPADVDHLSLAAYIEHDRQTRLGLASNRKPTELARAWNRTVDCLPQPTGIRPILAERRRTPYTFPLEAYSAAFQEDVGRFSAALAPPDGVSIYRSSGGRRRKPSTVKARLFSIRQAAAALVHSGKPIGDLHSLRDLVDPPEHAMTILEFYDKRAASLVARGHTASETGGQAAAIATTLVVIAKRHAPVCPEDLRRLKGWRDIAAPKRPFGMTGKVRDRLRRMIEPRNRNRLLMLAEEAFGHDARRGDPSPLFARSLIPALAVDILLGCPLRLNNLRNLRLGDHLQRIGRHHGQVTHIIIDAAETKNGEPIEWPLSEETAELLELWLTRYRPLLVAGDLGHPYLFPGARKGKAMSENGLRGSLERLIHKSVGIEIHPHLFRHFAAWRHLNRRPGEYEIVRRVLGHKSVDTTVQMYCGLETEAAARHYDRTLLEDRSEARLFTGAARKRRPRSSGARGPGGSQ